MIQYSGAGIHLTHIWVDLCAYTSVHIYLYIYILTHHFRTNMRTPFVWHNVMAFCVGVMICHQEVRDKWRAVACPFWRAVSHPSSEVIGQFAGISTCTMLHQSLGDVEKNMRNICKKVGWGPCVWLFCALFVLKSVCPFLGSFDDAAVEAGAVYDEAHQRRVYLSAPAKEYRWN